MCAAAAGELTAGRAGSGRYGFYMTTFTRALAAAGSMALLSGGLILGAAPAQAISCPPGQITVDLGGGGQTCIPAGGGGNNGSGGGDYGGGGGSNGGSVSGPPANNGGGNYGPTPGYKPPVQNYTPPAPVYNPPAQPVPAAPANPPAYAPPAQRAATA